MSKAAAAINTAPSRTPPKAPPSAFKLATKLPKVWRHYEAIDKKSGPYSVDSMEWEIFHEQSVKIIDKMMAIENAIESTQALDVRDAITHLVLACSINHRNLDFDESKPDSIRVDALLSGAIRVIAKASGFKIRDIAGNEYI